MNGDIAIIKILLDDTNVSSLVSTRVYPYIADEETALPYIVVMSDGIEGSDTKTSSSALDVETLTIQINDLHEGGNAVTLGTYVRAAVDRYSGTVTAGTISVIVNNVFFDSQNKFIERETTRTLQIVEQQYHARIKKTPTYIRS